MRLFIALELPAPVRTELTTIQRRLQRTGQHPVKWVPPDSIHLTLQFLGDVEPERVAELLTALYNAQQTDTAGRVAGGGDLRLANVGAFPTLRRPQVVWVGVGGDTSALHRLQQRVVNAMQPLGFEPENRPFRAHLTLGRTRREASGAAYRQLGDAIAALPAPQAIRWPMGQPVLFQSTLSRQGAQYTRLTPQPAQTIVQDTHGKEPDA